MDIKIFEKTVKMNLPPLLTIYKITKSNWTFTGITHTDRKITAIYSMYYIVSGFGTLGENNPAIIISRLFVYGDCVSLLPEEVHVVRLDYLEKFINNGIVVDVTSEIVLNEGIVQMVMTGNF